MLDLQIIGEIDVADDVGDQPEAARGGAVDALQDVVFLLLDQARLMDGETLSDPAEFGRRLGGVLKQAV